MQGMFAVFALLIHSPSPIRHAFYETFLQLHVAMAIAMIITIWIHLKDLWAQRILIVVAGLWFLDVSLAFVAFASNPALCALTNPACIPNSVDHLEKCRQRWGTHGCRSSARRRSFG